MATGIIFDGGEGYIVSIVSNPISNQAGDICHTYIDVANRKHSVRVRNKQSETIKQDYSFTNDRDVFDKLLLKVYTYSGQLLIALESIWQYWLPLYGFLTTAGHQVWVLNPLQIHICQPSGIRNPKI